MKEQELVELLDFLRRAERLKDTLRASFTSTGKQESTAEHTWRLCLMALTLEDYFPEVDIARVLKICIVHDLGEAINGDIPAPQQNGSAPKAEAERKDLRKLMEGLPGKIQQNILELWDEYEQAATREAKLAKALDKLETIMQHNQGDNPPDFDYAFNLEYGKKYTDEHPVIVTLRKILDEETEGLASRKDST